MLEAPPFDELLRRVRSGDQEAATLLVRHYEPAIRRVVRLRLAGIPLAALLDSVDICQSVLASFFVRVGLGQYHLETPEQLVSLLATMARSKLAAHVRHQQAQRRDRRRNTPASGREEHLPAVSPTPSQQIAARDLLDEVQRRLSPEELRLVEMRSQGQEWEAVAAQLGGSAEALRKRLARAIDRVARELGLEDEL
jgi:RNA polymerase sigma factor (sigma-70 family)